jgi:hypothetical protein
MNDLSGEDAFDKVLEAALARRAVEETRTALATAAAAARDADRAKDDAARLKQEKENGLPRLTELWQAAKAVRDFRSDTLGSEDMSKVKQLMGRLDIALDAAANWCDEIPF